jgi:hypothetical protein
LTAHSPANVSDKCDKDQLIPTFSSDPYHYASKTLDAVTINFCFHLVLASQIKLSLFDLKMAGISNVRGFLLTCRIIAKINVNG